MEFVWDPAKAAGNAAKHGITFEEACTVFLDPLSATGADPDRSLGEARWLTFGRSSTGRLLVVSHTDQGSASSVPAVVPPPSGNSMSKAKNTKDTLRTEYKASDFPGGLVHGKYAQKAAASSNIVVLDPEVSAAFPNSASVNDALRALLEVAKNVGPHP